MLSCDEMCLVGVRAGWIAYFMLIYIFFLKSSVDSRRVLCVRLKPWEGNTFSRNIYCALYCLYLFCVIWYCMFLNKICLCCKNMILWYFICIVNVLQRTFLGIFFLEYWKTKSCFVNGFIWNVVFNLNKVFRLFLAFSCFQARFLGIIVYSLHMNCSEKLKHTFFDRL